MSLLLLLLLFFFVNQKMGSGTFNSVFISLALVTVFLSTLVTAYLYVFPLFFYCPSFVFFLIFQTFN